MLHKVYQKLYVHIFHNITIYVDLLIYNLNESFNSNL